MAASLPQLLLTCAPGGSGGYAFAACVGAGDGSLSEIVAVEGYVLTKEQYQALGGGSQPFDVVSGAGFFSFGLGVVVACWVVAHMAGLVVQSVRSV